MIPPGCDQQNLDKQKLKNSLISSTKTLGKKMYMRGDKDELGLQGN